MLHEPHPQKVNKMSSTCLRSLIALSVVTYACCVHGLDKQALHFKHKDSLVLSLRWCCCLYVVTLAPKVLCLSPGVSEVTVTCMTNTTAILWIYNHTNQLQQIFYNNDYRPINKLEQLGVFSVQLTMVSADGYNYTSTATVNGSSLVNISTLTISCDGDGDGIDR